MFSNTIDKLSTQLFIVSLLMVLSLSACFQTNVPKDAEVKDAGITATEQVVIPDGTTLSFSFSNDSNSENLTVQNLTTQNLTTQGLPYDGSGNPAVTSVKVEIFQNGQMLKFNSAGEVDAAGTIPELTPTQASLTLQVPQGATTFKAKGYDSSNNWLAYQEQSQDIFENKLVPVVLKSILASLDDVTPALNQVNLGNIIRLPLKVRPNENASLQVPFQDYDIDIKNITGGAELEGTGSQAAVVQADGSSALSFEVEVTGLVLDSSGDVVTGTLTRSVAIPLGVTCPSGNVVYVNADASGNSTGGSWADAFMTLGDALDFISAHNSADCSDAITEVWVARGRYYPDEGVFRTDDDRENTFQLTNNLAIYGGFVGTETAQSQANSDNNSTILSGDIGQDDTTTNGIVTDPNTDIAGNNAYSVVTGSGTNRTAILDGVVITAGRANVKGSDSNYRNGGGMFNRPGSPSLSNIRFVGNFAINGGGIFNGIGSSPTLSNVSFENNSANTHGGGIYNSNNSSPILDNVTFEGNYANLFGGAMYNFSSSPILTNVTFEGNYANTYGGAMYNDSSSPTLNNVTFGGNTADDNGGAMYNSSSSSPSLSNVTFEGNSSSDKGGAMYNRSSSPILSNVTFEGNSTSGSLSDGGAMYNYSSSPILSNVTFEGNSSSNDGGAMYNSSSSSPRINNSIFWNNSATGSGNSIFNLSSRSAPVIKNSYFSTGKGVGSVNGGGNFFVQSANPFVDSSDPDGPDNIWHTADDGLRLADGSATIDAGDNSLVPAGVTTDILGNPRFYDDMGVTNTGTGTGAIVDMGAYEKQQSSPRSWQSLIVGSSHTCGITSYDKAYCWGWGHFGQLGIPTEDLNTHDNGNKFIEIPTTIDTSNLGSATSWKSLSSGLSDEAVHTCGIASDFKAYCWGGGRSGKLGIAVGNFANKEIPTAIDTSNLGSATGWKSIVTGTDHTCGIASDDKVYCWGSNDFSQLGIPTEDLNTYLFWRREGKEIPTAVDTSNLGSTVLESISAGDSHTCGIASDKQVYCWGNGGHYQLGIPEGDLVAVNWSTRGRFKPTAIDTSNLGSATGWKSISAGFLHTCGITNDDKAYCWGRGTYGQLGIPTEDLNTYGLQKGKEIPTAVDTSNLGSATGWKSISAGDGHTCGITNDDKAYCWGWGTNGQLGIPAEDLNTYQFGQKGKEIPTAVDISNLGSATGWKAISAGDRHTCGITNDDKAYCWGAGLLGIAPGDTTSREIPTAVY